MSSVCIQVINPNTSLAMTETIGAAARAAHRRQRLQELAAQIEEGQRELAEIREGLAVLARRGKALRAEIDGAPKDGAVRQAHAALAASYGLGLAIADEIARVHHAALTLGAGSQGRGLVVAVVFPPEPPVA